MESPSSSSSTQSSPFSVDDIFADFRARNKALIRALTDEIDQLFESCPPGEKVLCLFGHSDGRWEVTVPFQEVPPEIPEPTVGINFARDGMPRKDWIALVAFHSEAWLIAVAFYLGARLSQSDRDHLFSLICSVPSVSEAVRDWNKRAKDNPKKDNSSEASGSKSMEAPSSSSTPSLYSVGDIFADFSGRRKALIRALTHETDQLYQDCPPGEKELCLFGYPDKRWKVTVPFQEVPPVIPEPTVGINFTRDGMPPKEWIAHVAVRSDIWLIAVASYLGARLIRSDSVAEAVRDWNERAKDNSSEASGSKSRSSGKRPSDGHDKSAQKMVEESQVQNEEDNA